MSKKETSHIGGVSWGVPQRHDTRPDKPKYRLESHSTGYTIVNEEGLTVETFGLREFGQAVRAWHKRNEE